MTIEISDRWWKWLALALALFIVGYVVIWPRLDAGIQAATYINQCVYVGACPSADQLQAAAQRIAQQKAAQTAVPAPPASPTPAPSPAPKGK